MLVLHNVTILNVLLVLIWTSIRFSAPNGTPLNVHEYNILCRIYRIALEGQSIQPDNWVRQRLGKEESGFQKKDLVSLIGKLNMTEDVKEVEDLDGRKIQLKRSPYLSIQSKRLHRTMEKINTLAVQMEEEVRIAGRMAGEAKSKFAKAISGDDAWADFASKPTGRRSAVCAKGAGGHAGESIRLDLACICTKIETDDRFCGFATQGSGWESSVTNLKEGWALVDADCKAKKVELSLTPAFINRSLESFEDLIGKGGRKVSNDATSARYRFGQSHASAACGATSSTPCVLYATAGHGRAEVQWEKEMEQASKRLEDGYKAIGRWQKLQQKLDSIEELTLSIVNETFFTAQFENPKPKTEVLTSPNGARREINHSTDALQASPLRIEGTSNFCLQSRFILFAILFE